MNRLKLLSLLFAGALLVGACKQKPAYKVSGTVVNPVFEGAKVYLIVGDDPFKVNITDSTVVSGGKYAKVRAYIPCIGKCGYDCPY